MQQSVCESRQAVAEGDRELSRQIEVSFCMGSSAQITSPDFKAAHHDH